MKNGILYSNFNNIKSSKYFTFFLCFLISFVSLLICSKNSYLYEFNDWVDANCFFTVGKSMVRGVLPYKELFEQKGPLLYLIYGLGSLIQPTNFHGVFIFEVLSFAFFNYYILKFIREFVSKKGAVATIMVLDAIIVSRIFFVHGGSAEEFVLPYMAYSFYSFFKYTRDGKYDRLTLFMNGLMAGIIVMIKYNLIGLSFAWMALIDLYLLKNKKFGEMISSSLIFLLGMFTPMAVFSIYFLLNDGLYEFIRDYFIINATAYTEQMILNSKAITIGYSLYLLLSFDLVTQIVLALGIIGVYFDKEYCNFSKLEKTFLAFAFISTSVFIFIGGRRYNYYFLPLMLFLAIGIHYGIYLVYNLVYNIFDSFDFKYSRYYLKYAVVSASIVLSVFTLFTSRNLEYINKTEDDYFQFVFAEEMNKYEKPTLLNYGWLDFGLYTTSGVIPETRYFQIQNISDSQMPELRGTQNMLVNTGTPNFIIVMLDYNKSDDEKMEELSKFTRYEVVDHMDQKFEDNVNSYFLLKEKEYNRVLAQE